MLNKNFTYIAFLLLGWAVLLVGFASAQTFETEPSVFDSSDLDNVFSPNNDNVQEQAVIGFVANGNFGDWRIIIDTHQPGGIGGPDGVFDADDDWTTSGQVNNLNKSVRQAWDGVALVGETNPVADGQYAVQVELDYVQNSNLLDTDAGYEKRTLTVFVDTQSPGVSALLTSEEFSPNGDGAQDTTTLEYFIKDGTSITGAELTFPGRSATPALALSGTASGTDVAVRNTFVWDGKDSLAVALPEGIHALTLRVTDAGGTVSEVQLSARIDVQAPKLQLDAPTAVYTRDTISVVRILVDPDTGSAIDYQQASTSVALRTSQNAVVAGTITFDEAANGVLFTPTKPIAGTQMNDTYTVSANATDKAGNRANASFTFTYDTQSPQITSATSGSGATLAASKPVTLDATDSLTLQLSEPGNSGVDFASPSIVLRSAAGTALPIQVSDDGVGSITVGYTNLQVVGSYALEVSGLSDRAGNVANTVTYPFAYGVTQLPELVSLSPGVGSATNQLRNIVAQLQDNSGSGIDMNASSIQVTTTAGDVLAATLSSSGDQLTWNINTTLPRDGSQDGAYTVEVTVADKVGSQQVVTTTLTYDSQPPKVVSTIPVRDALVGTLNQATVTLSDVGSGIDFAATQVQLLAPDGSVVNASQTDDGISKIELRFDARATDGSEDGRYSLVVTPVDVAGNVAGRTNIRFDYATQLPELVSLSPGVGSATNQLRNIVAQLQDNSGSGIDMNASSIQVTTTAGDVLAATLSSSGDQLTWNINTTLPRDGSQDGAYTVEVTVADKVGSQQVVTTTLTYDSQPPKVVSTIPVRDALVGTLNQATVTLSDVGSGIDFAATQVQLLAPDGSVVNASQTDDGISKIELRFDARATDGSEDGRYSLVVTPVDVAGNVAGRTNIRFDYATQLPEVAQLSLAESGFVNQLLKIEAQLAEFSGQGIDFAASSIRLMNPDGTDVPGRLTNDKASTLVFTPAATLPTDGSTDGNYTAEITIVSKMGVTAVETVPFVYDTVSPELVTVTPANGSGVETANPVVVLQVSDVGSGVDFAASTVQLTGPGGSVQATMSANGVDTITLKPATLSATGQYTVQLQLVDRAGNAGIATESTFTYTVLPPRVVSLLPADRSSVNALAEVRVTLQDGSGKGIDFAATGLSFQLLNVAGTLIEGDASSDGNVLVFTLSSQLATDGSDDGSYTVRLQPVDNTGNRGTERQFSFVYDTEEPELLTLTHVDFTQSVSLVSGQIRRIEAAVQDASSDVDFAASTIRLLNAAGEEVGGAQADNDANLLWWTLDSALPRGGSADGQYSIAVKVADEAGNVADKLYQATYDTQSPTIAESVPVDGGLVNTSLAQVSVKLSDELSGVDLLNSQLQLIGPNGAVGANQADDGVDTLTLRFSPLKTDGTADGSYRLEVIPVDLAGNTLQAPVVIDFFYVTQAPELVSTSPERSTYVTSLSQVTAVLRDNSGQGIDLDASTVRVTAADGTELVGRQTDDQAGTINWILAQPLPTDGSKDGGYILLVNAVDKAGATAAYEVPFMLDTLIPQFVSLDPEPLAELDEAIREATIVLTDHNDLTDTPGSGIDFESTTVIMIKPDETVVQGNIKSNGVDTITFTFPLTLATGRYYIRITPADRAGNISKAPVTSWFTMAVNPPVVLDVKVSGAFGEYTRALTEIRASLRDRSQAGLNLTPAGSTIQVKTALGATIDGEQRAEDEETLVWTPVVPLAADGSQDGRYTITVLPIDNGNRIGQPRIQQIVYDTQAPEVTSLMPGDVTRSLTHVGPQVSRLEANIVDENPSGFEIEDQGIQLVRNGQVVAGTRTDDGQNLVIWTLNTPLPADGSADGEYEFQVELRDRAGNSEVFTHSLIYDTLTPELVSTDPSDGAVITGNIRSVTTKLSDQGLGRIDFDASEITLLSPAGNLIAGTLTNNGLDVLTLSFDGLEEDGTYTMSIQAMDRAGNGAGVALSTEFFYSTSVPVVLTTEPTTVPAEAAYASKSLESVSATLRETNNGGIDFSPIGSTIRLYDSNGNLVPGNQSDNGNDVISWDLAKALETDGSDDGVYSIAVVPANESGRRGDEARFSFTYDTVEPEVDLDTLQLKMVETGALNSLNEIQVTVSDPEPASGLDWKNLDSSWIELIGPDGKPVASRVTSDKAQTLILRIEAPLASDGSQDGEYAVSVAPVDKAGNTTEAEEYTFVYDTEPPQIDAASLLLDGKPLQIDRDADDFPSATNAQDGVVIEVKLSDTGLGVDLALSQITVVGPNGEPVSGTLQQNGVDTVQFRSNALSVQGMYHVTIKATGLDKEDLGIRPTSSLGTSFLFELGKPTAQLTDSGTETSYEDEEVTLRGTAQDVAAQDGTPSSGVALVEIGATGPDGTTQWLPAIDDSESDQDPWAKWYLDFLPSASGEYELTVRVTDNAGNSEVFKGVTLDFSVSLAFRGGVYCWPNPASRGLGDTAHISYDVNIAQGQTVDMTLFIYTVAGDLVYEEPYNDRGPGRDDQTIHWDLTNSASGDKVVSGIYVFRLEADTGTNNANRVGRILVVR